MVRIWIQSRLSFVQSRSFLEMALMILFTIIWYRCLMALQVLMGSVYKITIFMDLMIAVPPRIAIHRPHSIRINQGHHCGLLHKSIMNLKDILLPSRWWPTGHLCTTAIHFWMKPLPYHHHYLRMGKLLRVEDLKFQQQGWFNLMN